MNNHILNSKIITAHRQNDEHEPKYITNLLKNVTVQNKKVSHAFTSLPDSQKEKKYTNSLNKQV
jgi:hypothetical protein